MHGEANTFTMYITSQRSRNKILRCTTFSWTCFEELGLSFTKKPNFSSHVYILQTLQKHMRIRGTGEGVLHSLNALKLDKWVVKLLHCTPFICSNSPVLNGSLQFSEGSSCHPVYFWNLLFCDDPGLDVRYLWIFQVNYSF